ncbi:malate dehydrogenase [Tanacetum coccineum]
MDHRRKMYHRRDMENRASVKVNMNGKTMVSSKPQESLACLKIRWGSKRMKLDGVQRKIDDTENGSGSGARFWGQNVVSGNEAARGVKKMENEPEVRLGSGSWGQKVVSKNESGWGFRILLKIRPHAEKFRGDTSGIVEASATYVYPAYQVCCSAISVSIPSILQAFGATAHNLFHVRFMAEMMYVDVKNVIIWGNHSSTQYPDVTHATVEDKPVLELIKDDEWKDLIQKKFDACLSWPRRFNIINGMARGTLYLHQDSRLQIIHRDLKINLASETMIRTWSWLLSDMFKNDDGIPN